MANNETAHELILQILKTRMTFRQTIQRVLRTNVTTQVGMPYSYYDETIAA